MDKFIEVTELKGDKIILNSSVITYVSSNSDSTTLHIAKEMAEIINARAFVVKESYDEIKKMLV